MHEGAFSWSCVEKSISNLWSEVGQGTTALGVFLLPWHFTVSCCDTVLWPFLTWSKCPQIALLYAVCWLITAQPGKSLGHVALQRPRRLSRTVLRLHVAQIRLQWRESRATLCSESRLRSQLWVIQVWMLGNYPLCPLIYIVIPSFACPADNEEEFSMTLSSVPNFCRLLIL